MLKDRSRQKAERARIWGVKTKTIPGIVGALGERKLKILKEKGNLKILKNLKKGTLPGIRAYIFLWNRVETWNKR